MITRATIEGSDKFGTSQNGAKYRIKILQKRKAFISRWTTNVGSGGSNTDQVQLPLINGKTYDMVVDWGDGTSDTITSYNQAETLHTYSSIGTYTITMTGTNGGLKFNNGGDKAKINQISQWGTLDISSARCFDGCANLDVTATDAPIVSVTNAIEMFRNCTSLTGGCDNWDVSGVTGMQGFFQNCTNFNGDISGWDVSGLVGSQQFMFRNCANFNKPIGKWDVSGVTAMNFMFQGCTNFNQDLNDWDTSNVTAMDNMFSTCTNFNGNIADWDTSSVTNMAGMFFFCTNFNQDIGSWDTSSVTSMSQMLRLTGFDQDISGWDITNVTNLSIFLLQSALSTVNYDALLVGWEAQAPQLNVNAHFGNSQYTSGSSAETARTSLINTYNWTITDGGAV